MQLETGKRYVTRDGRVTSLLRESGSSRFPFAGIVPGENYTGSIGEDQWDSEGRYLLDEGSHALDLVAEHSSEAPEVIPIAYRLDLVIEEVRAERFKQDSRWGEQNHEPQRWLSILMEEVGEAAQAANDSWDYRKTLAEQAYKQECYRQELIQVAAVTIAMIECLDRNGK